MTITETMAIGVREEGKRKGRSVQCISTPESVQNYLEMGPVGLEKFFRSLMLV
jgi:hypothetical protein